MASACVALRHLRVGAARTATLLHRAQHSARPLQWLSGATRIASARSLSSLHCSPLVARQTAPNAVVPFAAFQQQQQQQRLWFTSSATTDRKTPVDAPLPPPIPSLAQGGGSPNSNNKNSDDAQSPDAFKLEKDTWAERHCPEWMVPYIQLSRINRPAGAGRLSLSCKR